MTANPPQPSVLFTGAYLKGHYNVGIPGGPTVFDALANPPATGAAAESSARSTSEALGVVDPPEKVLALRQSHRDYVKDFYDNTGIYNTPVTPVTPT